jgi:hypothetical protein
MDYIKSFSDYLAEREKSKKESSDNTEDEQKVPKKYLSADTKKERGLMKKEIEKHAEKKDDDSSAYKKWPADYKGGDTSGEPQDTKKSAATMAYHKKFKKEESLVTEDEKNETALKNKEEDSGIPYGILKQVYDRGMAAWKTGHRPGVAQAQWAMGRVNSFITGEGKAREADQDLWDEYKGKK